jgi:hypothetical protein
MAGPDFEGMSIVMRALSLEAEHGNDTAAIMLETMMTALTSSKAAAVMAIIRSQEKWAA